MIVMVEALFFYLEGLKLSRYFMIQSWVGSHENEPDYNGQQCGERNVRSSEVVPLYDQYGNANIKAFSDEALESRKKRTIKKKSVADSIDLAEKHFQRMEKLSAELDDEYFAGEIDEERYELLRYKMDTRLLKSWERLQKENAPIWKKEDEKYAENSLTFSLDEVTFETKRKSFKSLVKPANKSLIDGNGWASMALKDCKETNLFLIGFCKVLEIIDKIKRGI